MADIAQRGNRLTAAKGGRIGKFGGGRTNLLEQLGRVEAEPSNPNRRAEISRVHGELNRGYAIGGVVKKAIKKLRPAGPFKPKKKAFKTHGKDVPTMAAEGGRIGLKDGSKKFVKGTKREKQIPMAKDRPTEGTKLILHKGTKPYTPEGEKVGKRIGLRHGEEVKKTPDNPRLEGGYDPKKQQDPKTWDKRREGVGAAKRKPPKSFQKKKKYTKEQLAMHKSIKEKRHGGKKFKGKVFDASPIQLAKAGMTESKMYGLPAHSQKYVNGKLQYAKPYGGTIDTGFKGYDKSTPGVGLKSGGKADKKWIQKAVNPKHKGYCTPMTKKTCTPARKALARTFKKKAKTGWG